MPIQRATAILIALFSFVGGAAGQDRPLRLFLSTIGLSDPADPLSPAVNPTAGSFGEIATAIAQPGQPARLYLWAQLNPPGPPTVTYAAVSVRLQTYGGTISGAEFWNFSAGAFTRWQVRDVAPLSSTAVEFRGAAVTVGAGVTNSPASAAADQQRLAYALDGVTRIDCTLLGYVDVESYPDTLLVSVRLAVGSLGIVRTAFPPQPVYLGWCDEYAAARGDWPGAGSPLAEAMIYFGGDPCPDGCFFGDCDCDGIPNGADACFAYPIFDFDEDGRYGECDPCPCGVRGPCGYGRGDLDCSGRVDFFDIDPFVRALFDVPGYRLVFPHCDEALADLNLDGSIDFFDIDPFIACLFAATCP